ncbi:MAG TPA: serine hydrolase domain-containing protein [Rubrobacter sp.]|nr:serine hydrolase domain-containing protein [Rubrobacter sp.]
MRKTVLSLASLAAALLLASGIALAAVPGGSAAGEKGAGPTNTIAADAALDGALKSLVARHGGPPGAIAVVQRGKHREVHAFGVGNIETGRPMRADDHMRIASAAKAFSGGVALSLVGKGELSLNDTIGERLPELPDAWSEVTLRQLLNHTSGIPDYSQTPNLGKELLADRDRRWSSTEVIALIENIKPQFPAGTGYQYSNTDYVLLGEVIGAVTGTSWAQQVRDRILDPLHLDHTFIPGIEPVPVRPLPGYFDADNDGDEENIETGRTWPALETSEGPAGAMVSNAEDLVTFGDALFHGRLLQPRTFHAMVTEGQHHPPNSNYGLGLEIVRPDYQTLIWGHGGFLPGFKAVLWYVPSRDAVIVVLTNTSRANPPDLAELILRTLPERTPQP